MSRTHTYAHTHTQLGWKSDSINNLYFNLVPIPDTSTNNIALGKRAAEHVTTCNFSTFIGHQAGKTITTGNYNLFVGDMAGRLFEEGKKNCFIGAENGTNLKKGLYNTFIGSEAGIQLRDNGVTIGELKNVAPAIYDLTTWWPFNNGKPDSEDVGNSFNVIVGNSLNITPTGNCINRAYSSVIVGSHNLCSSYNIYRSYNNVMIGNFNVGDHINTIFNNGVVIGTGNDLSYGGVSTPGKLIIHNCQTNKHELPLIFGNFESRFFKLNGRFMFNLTYEGIPTNQTEADYDKVVVVDSEGRSAVVDNTVQRFIDLLNTATASEITQIKTILGI